MSLFNGINITLKNHKYKELCIDLLNKCISILDEKTKNILKII